MKLHKYIKRAASKNQLKLESGGRYWRKYYIEIVELVWARNFRDGYQIDVYEDKYSGRVLI